MGETHLAVAPSPLPTSRARRRVATGLVGLATKVVYAELNSYNGFHQQKRGRPRHCQLRIADCDLRIFDER